MCYQLNVSTQGRVSNLASLGKSGLNLFPQSRVLENWACNTTFHCAQGILHLYRYWYLEILMWTTSVIFACVLQSQHLTDVIHSMERAQKHLIYFWTSLNVIPVCRWLKHCTSNWITDFGNVRWATDLLKLISIYKPMVASLRLPWVSQSLNLALILVKRKDLLQCHQT